MKPYGEVMQLIERQDWETQVERMPGLINIARVTIVLSLLMFQLISKQMSLDSLQTVFKPLEFYTWLMAYSGFIILTFLRPQWQQQSLALPNAAAVVDITMMACLAFIVGGVGSGFGILILPFVATSCLLSYGRYPILYASYATLLIALVVFLKSRLHGGEVIWDSKVLTTAILLVAACYLVAALTAFSATYLKRATESAAKHKLAYRRISGLNKLVLNRVQEAVVVIDVNQRVWLFNRQAKTYFPNLVVDAREDVFGDLVSRWQRQTERSFETDMHIYQHAMHVRAVPLIQEETQLLMLFIRSLREVAAEAMATKLASLGQLTANLAHEVRNPLSAIRHANDLLIEEDADGVTLKLRGIIESNILRIDKMLEEVSMLNKRDGLSRESINMMKFWLEFKQEFTLNHPDAVGCLKMNMDGANLTVSFDAHHLRQIMWNLTNNAWQHSRKDEHAVTVLIRSSGKMYISIVVADNGTGVPAESRNSLFEPFFTTKKEGTGLGLYVARELAHANMGQLHYHPEMNGFELILPKDEKEYD